LFLLLQKWAPIKLQKDRSKTLQVLISATTKPSYNTTKEQNRINHMGIRTPCYVTITDQNDVAKWISEHHAILQWKNKMKYALSCNFSQVIPIFLQLHRCSFL
jgi:hypothetical protein